MDPSSDKDDPEKKPPSRDLADFDPAEREFWDTEDDEEEVEAENTASAKEPLADDLEDLDEPKEEEDEDGADVPENEEEEDDDGVSDDLAPVEEESPGEPAKRQISRLDFVWMGVLATLLLVIVVYAVSLLFKNVPTSAGPDHVDFPVKGEKVVIGKIDTFWRKPDPEVDKVSLKAMLIPCAVVKLKSGSGSGRLRIFFENDEGDLVGDPITLAFTDGIFDSSGTAEMNIHSTEGFEHEGQYAAYVTAEFRFWHVNVFEGPHSDDQGTEFNKLTRVRISPKRP